MNERINRKSCKSKTSFKGMEVSTLFRCGLFPSPGPGSADHKLSFLCVSGGERNSQLFEDISEKSSELTKVQGRRE